MFFSFAYAVLMIAMSSLIIQKHNQKKQIDSTLNNFAIGMLVISCIMVVGTILSVMTSN